jgi:hypothetical protein
MPNAITSHVEDAAATIVARPLGAMDASGQASLNTLQQVTVSVAYDDLYEQVLSTADSTLLANSFTISGEGDEFAATLSNSANFQDVLARNMASAICTAETKNIDPEGTDASNNSVGQNLKDAIYNGMLNNFKRVFADSIPNLLESDWALSNTVGYAGGAADMAGKLVAAECEILAQQLPESNYELYMDASENPTTTALPLKHGDSIIFVFQVSQSAVSRIVTKTPGSNVDTGASAVAGGTASPYGSSAVVSYSSNSRKVAFKFTVAKSSGNTVDAKLASLTAIAE